MKWLWTTLLILAFASPAGAITYKEGCAKKWRGDYQMQQFCLEQQSEAYDEFFRWMTERGWVKNKSIDTSLIPETGPYPTILSHCWSKWGQSFYGIADYQMVMFCIEQQEKAYNRIK